MSLGWKEWALVTAGALLLINALIIGILWYYTKWSRREERRDD